ncbi:MAG TPA: hypothetical protein VHL98_15475 [Microvirga sp.]|jgi:hypothetical protein|nr:hypothetical protein [Microvirga sp.]
MAGPPEHPADGRGAGDGKPARASGGGAAGVIAPGQRPAAVAFAVLTAVALLCAWQVLSGLLGGAVFTGAAGRALWIRWPSVPDLFLRAMLFYGLGFVVSAACAALIGYGLVDARRHGDDTGRRS